MEHRKGKKRMLDKNNETTNSLPNNDIASELPLQSRRRDNILANRYGVTFERNLPVHISFANQTVTRETHEPVMYNAAPSSSTQVTPSAYLDLGDCDQLCEYCHAHFWYAERLKGYPSNQRSKYNRCCKGGRVKLPLPREPPYIIKQFFRDRKFMENIRAYNQMFAMTSFGANVDDSINDGSGPYVFKVEGQISHWIGSLCPPADKNPRFLQMYIYDTNNEVRNRLRHFGKANPSSYTLTGIWPFNGSGKIEGLELKMETLINRIGERDDSTVTRRKQRDVYFEHDSSKIVSTSSTNDLDKLNGKRLKVSESKGELGGSKTDQESSLSSSSKAVIGQTNKPTEPPKDYIHVRARRGQATDSHSLAERARREKISERMKILQDLVPGCNKVIGKALVLDEIINYIQSLQHQVEFLSMKLETVTTRMNSPVEGFPTKDQLGPPSLDAAGLLFGSQTARQFVSGSQPEWLHMQLGNSFGRS